MREPMKIIVLDRDGVINHDSDNYIRSPDEFKPITGSIEAIVNLSKAGYTVCVATNQSGIGRGYFDAEILSDMHHLLCSMVEQAGGSIDGIFYCPHLPEENCTCRKPGTGLLEQIENEFATELGASYFVGDSLKDIQAAVSFGCSPILVRTGKGAVTEKALQEEPTLNAAIYDDLSSAVTDILGR